MSQNRQTHVQSLKERLWPHGALERVPSWLRVPAGGCREQHLCDGGVVSMGRCARHVILGFWGLDGLCCLHLEGARNFTQSSRACPRPIWACTSLCLRVILSQVASLTDACNWACRLAQAELEDFANRQDSRSITANWAGGSALWAPEAVTHLSTTLVRLLWFCALGMQCVNCFHPPWQVHKIITQLSKGETIIWLNPSRLSE